MPLDEAIARFGPDALHDGYNTVGGGEIFYVSNPSLGLWSIAERFAD
jgi:hypothetical protein